MKVFVISDIHGSSKYLEDFMSIYNEENDKSLIILGDVLYHGPRNPLPEGYDSQRVIQILSPLKDDVLWIRGNCDAEVDEMVLGFNAISNKKLSLNGKTFYLTHGHRINEIIDEVKEGDILLHGHTHINYLKVEDGIIKGNPGSLSLPKENTKRSFMVISEDKIEVLSLDKEVIYSMKY